MVTVIIIAYLAFWLYKVSQHNPKTVSDVFVQAPLIGQPVARVAGTYQAVKVTDFYVFVHPRGNGDIIPGSQDTYDFKNLQKGINMAQKQGRELRTFGTYYINRSLMTDKYKDFIWDATKGKLESINNDKYVMVDRPVPTDNGDANVMIQYVWEVRNLKLQGSGTGLRPGPTYGDGEGSTFANIKGKGLEWLIDLEFCLNADVYKPAFVNCDNGIKIQYGGRWGGSNSNSQSNNVRVYKPRFYAHQNSQFGIHVFGCSGVVIDEPIIEGHKVDVGIFFDGDGSTVVKDGKIINGYHFECVNGATTAALKGRLLGGKLSLDGYFGQYPTIVADMASTGGYMEFEFSNMQWARAVNGKLFRNGGCTWEGSFSQYESGAIKASNFPQLVTGIAVQECGGDSCGYNKFWIVETPR